MFNSPHKSLGSVFGPKYQSNPKPPVHSIHNEGGIFQKENEEPDQCARRLDYKTANNLTIQSENENFKEKISKKFKNNSSNNIQSPPSSPALLQRIIIRDVKCKKNLKQEILGETKQMYKNIKPVSPTNVQLNLSPNYKALLKTNHQLEVEDTKAKKSSFQNLAESLSKHFQLNCQSGDTRLATIQYPADYETSIKSQDFSTQRSVNENETIEKIINQGSGILKSQIHGSYQQQYSIIQDYEIEITKLKRENEQLKEIDFEKNQNYRNLYEMYLESQQQIEQLQMSNKRLLQNITFLSQMKILRSQ